MGTESLHIALDVEGVLANSHAAARRRSDLLTAKNTPPHNYDFADESLYEEYMHVSQNAWHNHWEDIPPMQVGIGFASERLSAVHDVDILTSRTGVDDQIQEWLDFHNVEYDEFIVTSDPRSDKTDYGDHDVHIDDGPHVALDALQERRQVFLVDRRYNQHVHGSRLHRVKGVVEAALLLTGRKSA